MTDTNTTEVTRSEAWTRGYEKYLEYWVTGNQPPTISMCSARWMPEGQERRDVLAGWKQAQKEASNAPAISALKDAEARLAEQLKPVDVLRAIDTQMEYAVGADHEFAKMELADLRDTRDALSCLLRAGGDAARSARVMHDDRQQEVVAIPVEAWTEFERALERVRGP